MDLSTKEVVLIIGILCVWSLIVLSSIHITDWRKSTMRVWTNNQFIGHWTGVPTAAVIIAKTAEEATVMLNKELLAQGLKATAKVEETVELKTHKDTVLLLSNGDY